MTIVRYIEEETVKKLDAPTEEVNQQELIFLKRQPYFQGSRSNSPYPYKVEIKITRVYGMPYFAFLLTKIKLAVGAFLREIRK